MMDVDRIPTHSLIDLYNMRVLELKCLESDMRFFQKRIKTALSKKDKSAYMYFRKKSEKIGELQRKTEDAFYILEEELSSRLSHGRRPIKPVY